jgi:dihydrofolate reductase
MKLTITTNVSVDGVMQGLGGSDEDRRGGFERGGWAIPLLDAEAGDHINEIYGGASAFLFGRRTYEIFAGSWGAIGEMRAQPIGVALNRTPKHVVSASLTDPQWAGTTVLTGDIAAAVRDLKAQRDGELLVPGSGALVRWLLASDLIDQLPRGDQRRAHLRPRRTRHRLVADRRPLRPARPHRPLAGHRPQPGHRGRRA